MVKSRKILKWLVVLIIIIKAIVFALIFVYPTAGLADTDSINSQQLINLTNDYRKSLGLSTLAVNDQLTQAATQKAKDMLAGGYFSHTSPDGHHFSDWIKATGYQYLSVGENLAIDFNDNSDLFQAWINSPKHKENIVDSSYQEIGLAAISGRYQNHNTFVVVQLFGSHPDFVTSPNVNPNDTQEAASGSTIPQTTKEAALPKQPLDFSYLSKINISINLMIFFILALLLITYQPLTNNQAKIAKPKIMRYQAKTANE